MPFYEPHAWILVSCPSEERPRVLGMWNGSYLHGAYWRINSGIVRVEEKKNYFLFVGDSGSEYKCYKDRNKLLVIGYDALCEYKNFIAAIEPEATRRVLEDEGLI